MPPVVLHRTRTHMHQNASFPRSRKRPATRATRGKYDGRPGALKPSRQAKPAGGQGTAQRARAPSAPHMPPRVHDSRNAPSPPKLPIPFFATDRLAIVDPALSISNAYCASHMTNDSGHRFARLRADISTCTCFRAALVRSELNLVWRK